MISKLFRCLSLVAVATGLFASAVHAQLINYHVGRDNLQTLISGTYSGLANPNYQRLTFLRFNNLEVSDPATSHWHAIGTYIYTGPAATPTIPSTNGNNRIPETFTGFAPLPLLPGSGIFAGKLVSGIPNATPQSQDHYDRLEMRPVQELASGPVGSTENFLYNSSGGRWNQPLGGGAKISLELLSHSPGLKIATQTGTQILINDLDLFEIGQGDDWSFTPVFWTDGSAAPGTYSAQFRLVDGSGTYLPSGSFNLDFAVVPEPGPLTLIAVALTAAAIGRRRSSTAPGNYFRAA